MCSLILPDVRCPDQAASAHHNPERFPRTLTMQPRHLLFATLAATLACNAATAATIPMNETTMAVADCQSALPVFDGVIRKRPLAVQNEGDSNSFITCGMRGVTNVGSRNTTVQLHFVNNGATARSVSCTMVGGLSGFADPIYRTGGSYIQPGNIGTIAWLEQPDGFYFSAISCALPPGMGIRSLHRSFRQEIGN